MASSAEVAAMRRALVLAQNPGVPLGPNPRVGCVLLDADGAVVAEGYHRGAGHPHAEIDALTSAGERARGTTAVVTLEPCNHTGRTGPCADALLAAGVARLVYAQRDTNPVARGGGEALRTAGVDVEGGVLADEARAVNPIWTFAVENGRPYVTWKYAATLDGRSAAADGSSRWITSPEARADVHRLRAECDAILVGTGTVLADNPHLTVRDVAGQALDVGRQPLRVVIGLRTVPADAAVLDDAAETLVLNTREPGEVLKRLLARYRQHVLLEGGPTLAGAFLREGLVDRVIAYFAPAFLGAGPAALSDAGVGTIADAIRLEITDMARVGPDVRLTAIRKESS
ncbi:MAG TPA: bifunctional diaminohydroxyphosphoribosylaminopyrimidine deaminase/5-amino-6-(5-phosphoribosylamino)uracil reductase RibD [Jiangellaceae bacterium]|nr:bifunctional diaminohydroxyphosphoribosylaminopyrimidine deaminase/5-amino-6-(5-phosphoribosylamino)uracil reductase RibD [Jiangellaceae bacterium]